MAIIVSLFHVTILYIINWFIDSTNISWVSRLEPRWELTENKENRADKNSCPHSSFQHKNEQ